MAGELPVHWRFYITINQVEQHLGSVPGGMLLVCVLRGTILHAHSLLELKVWLPGRGLLF